MCIRPCVPAVCASALQLAPARSRIAASSSTSLNSLAVAVIPDFRFQPLQEWTTGYPQVNRYKAAPIKGFYLATFF